MAHGSCEPLPHMRMLGRQTRTQPSRGSHVLADWTCNIVTGIRKASADVHMNCANAAKLHSS